MAGSAMKSPSSSLTELRRWRQSLQAFSTTKYLLSNHSKVLEVHPSHCENALHWPWKTLPLIVRMLGYPLPGRKAGHEALRITLGFACGSVHEITDLACWIDGHGKKREGAELGPLRQLHMFKLR